MYTSLISHDTRWIPDHIRITMYTEKGSLPPEPGIIFSGEMAEIDMLSDAEMMPRPPHEIIERGKVLADKLKEKMRNVRQFDFG